MVSREGKATMPTSAVGSSRQRAARAFTGFTLLEMLVVLTIVAVATAGVAWSLRDAANEQLDRQAEQLQIQLEVARGIARATATTVRLRLLPDGYTFDGLTDSESGLVGQHRWINARLQATALLPVVLGPEPMGPPWRIELALGAARRTLSFDGWSAVVVE